MLSTIGQLTHEWAQHHSLRSLYFAEIDSTNLFAKTLEIDPSEERFLIVTDHQTKGRGRGTHTWTDVGADQLLASWIFNKPTKFQHTTAQLFGLALYRAARAAFPFIEWGLKAPNDLFIGPHKVAGLLIDIISGGPREQVIVGLGFNVRNHPSEIITATHLSAHTPRALDKWPAFLSHLLENFTWAAQESQLDHLSSPIQAELLAALNQHVLLAEPYTQVDAQGNLTTPTRHIRWTEL